MTPSIVRRRSTTPRLLLGLSTVALATVALSTVALAGAALATPSPPSFTGQTSVILVDVPVEVERRGEAVLGLTAEDFTVTSDGATLPIVAFEPIALTPSASSALPTADRQPSPAARRNVFFLFDLAFSHPQRVEDGVAAARRLVASGLDPSDLVGVGIYLPTGQLPVLLRLTQDRAAADRALAMLGGLLTGRPTAPAGADVAAAPDPLRLTGQGIPSLLLQQGQTDVRNSYADSVGELAMAPDGKRGAPDLLYNILLHSAQVLLPSVQARQRADIETMTAGLGDLAATLRPVRGRKIMALFSDGFPVSLVAAISGNVEIPRGGGSDLLAHVEDTMRELRRDGWVLHPVKLAGAQLSLGDGGLFTFAAETGGTLVTGTNDLAGGLGDALAASLHGYLLTVQAGDVAFDGAFHPLEVRVRDERRGLRLRHREGYRGPLPWSHRSEADRVTEASALVASGEERDELGVSALAVPLGAGPKPTDGATAGEAVGETDSAVRVAIVVEVPGAGLDLGRDGRLGLEVYGYAIDAGGVSRDHFAYAVDLDSAQVGDRLAAGGVRVLGDLDLEPGSYRVRVFVRDRRDGRTTLRTVPVVLGNGELPDRVDALFLAAADDPWVLVPPRPDAFVVRGRSVLPATRATLAEGGEVQVLLLGSGLTGRHAVLSSRVVDAAGAPVAGADLELLGLTAGGPGEPDLVVGRLRAGTLPPGAYVLEVRLAGDAPTGRASTRPFRVVASKT